MERIIEEIRKERKRQDDKWGVRNSPALLWACILGEEVGEVNNAILEEDWDNLRTELIQVAAVAVATIESLDRQNGNKS